MIQFEELLNSKRMEIENILRESEAFIKKCPEGRIRISESRNNIDYYYCSASNKGPYRNGKYIKKKEQELISSLIQKDYSMKICKWAKDCYKGLCNLENVYKDDVLEDIYNNLSETRKSMINPIEIPTQKFVDEWQNVQYTGKKFRDEMPVILSNKEERVRSKSEKILADRFFSKNIPYRYEYPVYLKGFGTVYPDFTLLNINKRKQYYWEHLGMMDDPEYAEKAIQKIHMFEQNGIYPGEQLILTFESLNLGLNMRIADNLIKQYLC